MSGQEHSRFAIWSGTQHPYKHPLSDFNYTHPAFGDDVVNLQQAMDYLVAVLYPKQKAAVANVAALPAVGNTLNDMRVVNDDGDGRAASYRWEQREGEASASWHKIYDVDFGTDSILQAWNTKTLDVYVSRYGYDDLDANGTVVAGTLAGQSVFGGASANTNLTLFANSGDGVGASTGYVQFGDNVRPTVDNQVSLGTTGNRFLKLWTYTAQAGTLVIGAGSITDSSGAISFADENLSTTGTLVAGVATLTSVQATAQTSTLKTGSLIGNLTFANGSITDSGGSISFDDENLSTTGTLASGTHTVGDMVVASASITNTSGAISFDNENLSTTGSISGGSFSAASGVYGTLTVAAASITDSSGAISFDNENLTTTGFLTAGQVNADNLRLDGNTLSSQNANGDIALDPNGSGKLVAYALVRPDTDNAYSLGEAAARWTTLYLSTAIGDGTNTIAMATLLSFRDALAGAGAGMTLFYDGSKWNASAPDTEVDHGTVSGLADDDHTQYALLAGRSGGQTFNGSTLASENLTLDSTAHATKGSILLKSNLTPNTDASYAGSWTGTDLGSASKRFRNLYSAGEAIGLRLENQPTVSAPASAASTVGRLFFDTTLNRVYVDTGAAFVSVGDTYREEQDTSWNGTDTTKTVTLNTSGMDARKALWQLCDNTNNYERIFPTIEALSSTQVRITANIALAAGSYRLIGLQ